MNYAISNDLVKVPKGTISIVRICFIYFKLGSLGDVCLPICYPDIVK